MAAAIVPEIVGAERAGEANRLLGLLQGGVGIVGPGSAAGLFTRIGARGTLVILSSLYLLAVPLLLRIPGPSPTPSGRAASLSGEMAEGLRYLRRSTLLAGLLLCVVVFNLGFGGLSVIDVVFATRALHLPTATAGILVVASGVGGVIGGLVMTLAGSRLRGHYYRVLTLAVLAYGVTYLVYAGAPSLALAAVVLGLAGFIFIVGVVACQTIVQLGSADAMRGRVLSIFNTATAAGMLVSLSCAGALIDLWGVRAVIGGAAILILLCGGLCHALVRVTPALADTADVEAGLVIASAVMRKTAS